MTSIVDEATFQMATAKFDGLETSKAWTCSDEDTRLCEEMLQMEPGSIGAPFCFKSDNDMCQGCGKQTSGVDVIYTALKKAHSKEFLAKAMSGEMGKIITPFVNKLECSSCGKEVNGKKYCKVLYYCADF